MREKRPLLGEALGVGKDAISRVERCSDLLLSTLRCYIEAMGGSLELADRFADRPSVVVDLFAEPERERPRRPLKQENKSEARADRCARKSHCVVECLAL